MFLYSYTFSSCLVRWLRCRSDVLVCPCIGAISASVTWTPYRIDHSIHLQYIWRDKMICIDLMYMNCIHILYMVDQCRFMHIFILSCQMYMLRDMMIPQYVKTLVLHIFGEECFSIHIHFHLVSSDYWDVGVMSWFVHASEPSRHQWHGHPTGLITPYIYNTSDVTRWYTISESHFVVNIFMMVCEFGVSIFGME